MPPAGRRLAAWALLIALAAPTDAAPGEDALAMTDNGARARAAPAFPVERALRMEDGRIRVIVQLADPPVATYDGGVAGLAGTSRRATGDRKLNVRSPAALAYRAHLANRRANFAAALRAAAPGVMVDRHYDVVFHGVAIVIHPDDVRVVEQLPGVRRVYPDELNEIHMDASLPLVHAPEAWSMFGGQENAGEGMFVAIIDTGIRSENPLFDDSGFIAPSGFPPADSYCGPGGDPGFCNGKVIVARWYEPTFTIHDDEHLSPLDFNGHGTHVAGTAAGNANVLADPGTGIVETISGVAPRAQVGVYKGLFHRPDGRGSGSTTMLLAAINDAVADGADVVNNSWGGSTGGHPEDSAFTPALDAAAEAGVVFIFSAGNSGPGSGTIGCPGCVESVITVAASTTNRFHGHPFDVTGPGSPPNDLTNIATLPSVEGPGIDAVIGPLPIRYSGDIDPENIEGCDPFPANAFAGSFALIARGTCDFATKVNHAAAAGATAALIHDNLAGSLGMMAGMEDTAIPAVMMTLANGTKLRDWVQSNPSATGVLGTMARITDDDHQDMIASFSSRGPNGDPDVLKPDLAAPGVWTLSGYSPERFNDFAFLSGTSMAAPHVAGAAALVLQAHPDWTPAQVKSALTGSSTDTLTLGNVSSATPLAAGAGRLDAAAAMTTPLTFDVPSMASSRCHTCDWTRTLTNVQSSTDTFSVTVEAFSPGLALEVTPSVFPSVPPGESRPFTVSADTDGLTPGSWYFARVIWENSSGARAHLPVAVFAKGPPVFVDASATGANDGTSWADAFNSLRDALTPSAAPSTLSDVWVAAGTYMPDGGYIPRGGVHVPGIGSRSLYFRLPEGVGVYGGFAGWETDLSHRDITENPTILSGDLLANDIDSEFPNGPSYADNSFNVIRSELSRQPVVLDGFIITGGNATGSSGIFQTGGGMYIRAEPTVVNCTFIRNSGFSGGGIYIQGGWPRIARCTFTDNASVSLVNGGGGIFNNSTATVTDCTFNGNTAVNHGGGMLNLGFGELTVVKNCTFSGNSAGQIGGGMYNLRKAPTVINCTFSGNSAGQSSGGMHNQGSDTVVTRPRVVNSTFSGNSTGSAGGGGIHNIRSSPSIINCTFSGNTASSGAGGIENSQDSEPVIMNTLLVRGSMGTNCGGAPFAAENTHNMADDITCGPSFTQKSASEIRLGNLAHSGGPTATHALLLGSAAIDAGHAATCAADPVNNLDQRGRFRPVDGDGDGFAVCDIGAYEFQAPVLPAVIYVDAGAAGVNDGTSWTDAFVNLPDALATAAASQGAVTEIWVAAGTYMPDGGRMAPGGTHVPGSGSRTATLQLVSGVALYGGFAGGETELSQRDIEANSTILSGDLLNNDNPPHFPAGASYADNSFIVVTGTGTDSSAILDGFTITGGNANAGFGSNRHGGGMFNGNFSSPTVRNCRFVRNSAELNGGGMYNFSISSPTVIDCVFIQNHANRGGGMFNTQSNPIIIDCAFIGNTAVQFGGGMHTEGAGTDVTVTNCAFIGNSAGERGGGMYNGGASPKVTNSLFSGNAVTGVGGAIANFTSSPILTNCTFSANSATSLGGGVYNAAVLFGDPSSPIITNCILWANTDSGGSGQSSQIHTVSGTPVVNYSIVQGGWSGAGGTGVLSVNPLFVDAAGPDGIVGTEDDDLRLLPGSPAIDAGNNDAVPAGITTDLDGNPRFVDDPDTPDTGNPGAQGPPIVDMGAYEFQPIPPPPPPPVLFVDAAAAGAKDGTSWADAYVHLQDALATAAAAGGLVSEIWVAAGTYMPDGGYIPASGSYVPGTGLRTATFQLVSGVAVYGGFAGGETELLERDIAANPTILSGDLAGNDAPVPCAQDAPDCNSLGGLCVDGFCIIDGNNAENAFQIVTGSGTDATAVLDGFTITAGHANGITPASLGAGMYNAGGSPTVANCTFTGNLAGNGGGMYNINSHPVLDNCTFSRNAATGSGGGMVNSGSSPTLTHCQFSRNRAPTGGGMRNSNSSPSVSHCAFSGNAASNGGGMANDTSSSPEVTNCTFLGNSAVNRGGGMRNFESSPTLVNCLFSGNAVGSQGGGLFNDAGSNPALINCTFSGNTAAFGGGGIRNSNSSPTLTNCILWGNQGQISSSSSAPVVNYSIVQGGWTGAGGIGVLDADPLFVDADGPDGVPGTADDNLRLRPGSPAIDAGDNDAVPVGVTTDLDSNPRFVDDPDTPDPGNPGTQGPPIVDMGAYEFQAHAPPCAGPADLNCDGFVDGDDLAILAACAGGPNVPYDPQNLLPGCVLEPDAEGIIAADFDRDGDVDHDDFAVLQRCYSGPGNPPDPDCAG